MEETTAVMTGVMGEFDVCQFHGGRQAMSRIGSVESLLCPLNYFSRANHEFLIFAALNWPKMKYLCHFLLLTAFLCTANQLRAQDFQWAKAIQGTAYESGGNVMTDAAGNVYTVGSFQGTIDMNPGAATSSVTTAGGYDIFISKLDAAGNFLWGKRIGGTGYDYAFYMTIDPSGNLFLTGYYTGTVDFNPGAGSYSMTAGQAEDIFILKLNSNGDFVWARGCPGGSLDRGISLAFDPAGNVYTVGSFVGTVDFDPGPGVFNMVGNSYDAFLLKLDPAGNFLWAKKIGSSMSDIFMDIAVDNAGSIYATGYVMYTVDFDPGPGVANIASNGLDDVFVLKWDTDGNYIWARRIGSTQDDQGVCISLDASGDILVAGYFSGAIDFDPGLGLANANTAGLSDMFLWKLDNNGNHLWVKTIGGPGEEEPIELALDPGGELLMSGFFSETVDFNPGSGVASLTSTGLRDGFLLRTDATGDFISALHYGSYSDDRISSVFVDPSGNYYLTGDFQGTADFNPGTGIKYLNAVGSRDAFIVKFGDCLPLGHADTIVTCDPYTWNGTLYSVSGDYTVTVPSQNGCDSILTLHLTVNRTFDTLQVTACESYDLNGQTYTVDGTYDQVLTNSLGCDSLLTLILDIRNNTSATLNVTSCDSYELNGQTYTTSGTYPQLLENAAGCDSLLTLNLVITHSSDAELTVTACDSYSLNSQSYTESGTYNQLLTNAANCDSLLTVHLTILESTQSAFSVAECGSYTLNDSIYEQSGTYTQLLENTAGCDSLITLSLVIYPVTDQTIPVTACDTYTFGGTPYTTSGTYTHTFSSVHGCDSTVTIGLTVNQSNSGSETVTMCESYLWNGTNYTTSGIYTAALFNQHGCDSLATLHLTILPSSTGSETLTACDSITWNGSHYTTSGVYSAVLENHLGCDSVVTLHLTIHPSTAGSETIISCEPYTWNGTFYPTSGTYSAILETTHGCDSTATLFLTIGEPYSAVSTVTSCGPYTWTDGVTYETSGTYHQELQTNLGCDSTLTLSLTVTAIPVMAVTDNEEGLLTSTVAGAYQWIDCGTGDAITGADEQEFAPSENGSYAVIGTTAGCSDTSDCVEIDYLLAEQLVLNEIAVYPNPFHDQLTIVFPGETALLAITDVSGKQLRTMEIVSGEPVALSALIPGVYYVSVRTQEKAAVYTVVKD